MTSAGNNRIKQAVGPIVANTAPQPSAGNKELEYRPRVYGKSFKQWQQFIAYSRRGEDIVYRTPEGDICSPARVERLITASNQQLLRELEAKQDAYYLAHDGEGEAKMVAGLSAIIQDKLRSTDNAS